MCFGKEMSLTLFILGVFTSIKLMTNNLEDNSEYNLEYKKKITTGVGIFFIALMQLVEFFLWIYINDNEKTKKISYFILIVLILQILGYYSIEIGTGLLDFQSKDEDIKNVSIVSTITMILTFIFFTIIFYKFHNGKEFEVNTNYNINTCRLNWLPFEIKNDKFKHIFALFYMITMIMLGWINLGYKAIIIYCSTIILTMLYMLITTRKTISGSVWCFSIILLIIVLGIFDFNFSEEISKEKSNNIIMYTSIFTIIIVGLIVIININYPGSQIKRNCTM